MYFPEIGATNLSFALFLLSLDDSESLGDFSLFKSPLATFLFLFGVAESLQIERFNLVLSNGTTKVYMFQYLDLKYYCQKVFI